VLKLRDFKYPKNVQMRGEIACADCKRLTGPRGAERLHLHNLSELGQGESRLSVIGAARCIEMCPGVLYHK